MAGMGTSSVGHHSATALALALERCADGVLVIAPSGQIMAASGAARRALGMGEHARDDVTHWLPAWREVLSPSLPASRSEGAPVTLCAVGAHGQHVPLSWLVYRSAGDDGDYWVLLLRESAEPDAAFIDPLTGLGNRRAFNAALAEAVEAQKSPGVLPLAVLFLDVDRLKPVNDERGHLAGDQVLVELARRIAACVRPSDTVARRDGDEFTLLVTGLHSAADAAHIASRIHAQLEEPLALDRTPVRLSVSIGLVVSSGPHDADSLLAAADAAMYRAKAAGGARTEIVTL